MVEKVFIHVDEEIFAKRNFAVRDILGIWFGKWYIAHRLFSSLCCIVSLVLLCKLGWGKFLKSNIRQKLELLVLKIELNKILTVLKKECLYPRRFVFGMIGGAANCHVASSLNAAPPGISSFTNRWSCECVSGYHLSYKSALYNPKRRFLIQKRKKDLQGGVFLHTFLTFVGDLE